MTTTVERVAQRLSAAQLPDWIAARRSEGIELFVHNGKLRFRGSRECLTDDVMATLRANRDALHAWLGDEFERANRYPLSYSQQAVYMLYRLVADNPAYNTVFAALLDAGVDIDTLAAAYDAVAAQHPMFNTRFAQDEGGPYQHVLASQVQGLRIVDAADWCAADIEAWIERESDAPFDLAGESPFRATVLVSGTGAARQCRLVLTVHHIGADLWSLLLIAEQLQTAYRQLQRGEAPQLAPPPATYRDHVEFQQHYLRSAQGEADWRFWHDRLRDMPSLLALPTDFARGERQHMRGARVSLPLSTADSTRLREFCRQQGLTPFMVVHAALQLLLYRITGQARFVVGTPTAGRVAPGCDTVVGDFANPVVLCADFEAVGTGAGLLAQVRRQVVGALEHQAFPFPELVARLMPARDLRRSPLFQVMYVWHQAHPQSQLAGADALVTRVLPVSGPRGAPYDLMLAVSDEPVRLVCNWSYDVALFRASSINALAQHLVLLLQQLLSDAARKIAHFGLPPLHCAGTAPQAGDLAVPRHALDVITATWPERLPALAGAQLVDDNGAPAHAGQWCRVRLPLSDESAMPHRWYQPPLQLQAPLSGNDDGLVDAGAGATTVIPDSSAAGSGADRPDRIVLPASVRFDAGFGWSGSRMVSLAALEQAARHIHGVRDAVARCRWRAGGLSVTVLFVVVNRPATLGAVEQMLLRDFAGTDVVPVVLPHLPRTAQGLIDDSALQAVPCWSRRQQRQLERAANTPVLLACAPQYTAAEVLYLPDFGLHAGAPLATDDSDDHTSLASDVPLAYADGGELVIPQQAPRTLTEAFLHTAAHSRAPLIFVDELGIESRIDYAVLLREARVLTAGLQASGVTRGSVVLLQLAQPREFFPMFWACVLGGIVPVSVAVPDSYDAANAVARKVANVYRSIEGCIVIAADAAEPALTAFLHAGHAQPPRCLRAGALRALGSGREPEVVIPAEHDVVFLQLTSGSTGTPKAIQETHRGIIAHIHGAAQFNGYDAADVSLNWLPTDHVVPILTTHLKDCYLGTTQVQLATRWVLQQPLRWLDAVDKYRVTHTWSPNFAYRLLNIALLDALQRGVTPHWDLRLVRQFMNAGEQVTAAVIREFAQLFAPYGLNPAAMQPAFGMAECCTCITYRQRFDGEHATIATLQQPSRDFVDLGAPVPGVAIRIVDENNRLLPEGIIGRFQMKGAVVTPGYLDNPRANAESLLDDGWFNSGDLGFIRNGHLALTGREKETIILYGNNLYCYEIEEQVGERPGVRPTFVAAVGVRNETVASDELVLFYVPHERFAQRDEMLAAAAAVGADIAQHQGLRCRCVVPLQVHEFPKTTSGKIQRLQLKKEWNDGVYRDYQRAWDIFHRNDNTLPNWFYRPRWVNAGLMPDASCRRAVALRIVHDDTPLARDIVARLRDDMTVCASVAAHELGAAQLSWPAEVDAGDAVSVVLCTREADVAGQWFSLLQTLLAAQPAQRLLVLDSRPQLDEAPSALAALLQSVVAEHEQLDASLLLCDDDAAGIARCLSAEIASGVKQPLVRYHGGCRQLRAIDVVPPPAPATTAARRLRDDGVYVVTGAAGGIGQHLVLHLLATTRAQLILLSRRELPAELVALFHAARARVHDSVPTPRFVCVCADVTDAQALQGALATAKAALRLPASAAIDGAFHLAGHAAFEAFAEVDAAQLDAQLAAKVQGTRVLIEALTRHAAAPPLLVAFASVNGFFGGNRASAYAVACALQAAVVQAAQAQGRVRGYTLAWSQWSGIGMSAQQGEAQRVLAQRLGYLPITPAQGMASLDLVLQQPAGNYLIGLQQDCHAVVAHAAAALPAYVPCVLAPPAHGAGLSQLAQQLLLEGIDEHERCALLQRRASVAVIDHPLSSALLADAQARARIVAQLQCGEISGSGAVARIAPATDAERRVHAIWLDVLGRDCSTRTSFFEAGGDSLSAMQVASRLQAAFTRPVTVADLFTHTTIAQQAALFDSDTTTQAAAGHGTLPVRQQPPADEVPLSASQSRLWFLQQFTGNAALWNVVLPLRVQGEVAPATLQHAVDSIIDRHEIFSRRIVSANGTPVQRRVATCYPPVTVVDVGGGVDQLEYAAQHAARRPFDLATDVLLRVEVFRSSECATQIVQITTHHLVSDGWSLGVLLREFVAAFTRQTLAPLALQYADFALCERDWLAGLDDATSPWHDAMREHAAFWRDQLAGAPAQLAFYTDTQRPLVQDWQGDELFFALDADVSDNLTTFCAQRGVTPFMVLMAVYALLLGRYCREHDVVVGTAVANRAGHELEGIIGLFMNTLALRTHIDETQAFAALLAQVRDTTLQAYQHQQMPFEKVVELLAPPRNLGHTPIFQHMLIVQNAPLSPLQLPGLVIEPITRPSATAKFDMTMQWYQRDTRWQCAIEFCTALLPRQAVSDFFDNFALVLGAALARPEQPLAQLAYTSATQLAALAPALQRTPQVYAQDLGLFGVLAEHARTRGEAIAVMTSAATLSYAALYQRVCQLGGLLQQQGVARGDRVGIAVQRDENLPALLLAILSVGATYVPLDPDYPALRVAYMLEHSAPALLVTDTPSLRKNAALGAAGCVVCNLDALPVALATLRVEQPCLTADTEALAYVIYTSGSTGKPKGVQVRNRNLANFLLSMQQLLDFDATQRLLAVTSLSFDIAALELLLPLLAGASVVIATREQAQDGQQLRALVQRFCVTGLQATPVTWHLLLDGGWQHAGTDRFLALCGGEPMPVGLAQQLLAANVALFNVYGPTETTVWSTLAPVTHADGSSMAIGAPIANTQLYILDQYRNVVPQGVAGELYIGGDGVTAGYLGRDDLTQQAFIESPQGVIYKTGDLVRLGFDRALHCLGRIDNQIKLRGFRIELGEIETVLNALQEVDQSVVVADRATQGLIAVIVPAPHTPRDDETLAGIILQQARDQLPAYMVPNRLVLREQLPLTPNGKIDRKAVAALPEVVTTPATATSASAVAPRTTLEQSLLALWQTLVPVTGVTDNFFDHGGHSLLAARLAQSIEHRFAVRFPTLAIFNAPTVAACAQTLQRSLSQAEALQGAVPGTPHLLQEGCAETWVLFYPVDGALHHYGDVLAALTSYTVYGIEMCAADIGLDIQARARNYAAQLRASMANATAINLLGWSLGGVIAQAVAVELVNLGQRTGQLVMLDSYLPSQLPAQHFQLPPARMLAAFALELGVDAAFALTLASGDESDQLPRLQQYLQAHASARWQQQDVADAFVRFRANYGALQTHVPRVYDGAARLYRATQNPLAALAPAHLGWQPFVAQLVTATVEADHHAIVHAREVMPDVLRHKKQQEHDNTITEET